MKASFHLTYSRRAAFTLIELLVVISIIAVLAGLLLPVVNKVTENARKVAAKNSETQIVSAIGSFQTDYGQYPVASTDTSNGTMDKQYGVDFHNYTLFNVLRATETVGGNATSTVLNTRNIVYFEGKNVKNETAPKDGFTTTTTGMSALNKTQFKVGDYVDPWGNAYYVRIDTNYNNVVSNPYADPAGTNDDPTKTDASMLRLGAISYSFGADGTAGTAGVQIATPYTNIGDDVVSWQ